MFSVTERAVALEDLGGEESEYEYRGLKAATWDLFRGDTSNWADASFYREVIQSSGEPVLDVGCGTGRLLLEYLSQGVEIEGVDNSPEMLSLCLKKAATRGLNPCVYRQAMQSLRLPKTYRTIIVPSSSFQLLTDPVDATSAMRSFYRHLQPGGVLVMPFMILYAGPQEGGTVTVDWRLAVEKVRPEDGATVRLWSRTVFDLTHRLEHFEDRFEVVRGEEILASETHTRSPATCWYTQAQAVELYLSTGFDDIQVMTEFSGQRANAEDVIFCVSGRHAMLKRPPIHQASAHAS
jgi:SAM-dependent methyltransferase